MTGEEIWERLGTDTAAELLETLLGVSGEVAREHAETLRTAAVAYAVGKEYDENLETAAELQSDLAALNSLLKRAGDLLRRPSVRLVCNAAAYDAVGWDDLQPWPEGLDPRDKGFLPLFREVTKWAKRAAEVERGYFTTNVRNKKLALRLFVFELADAYTVVLGKRPPVHSLTGPFVRLVDEVAKAIGLENGVPEETVRGLLREKYCDRPVKKRPKKPEKFP